MNFELLKNRNFVKLWAGQSVSLFGSLVSRLALPFLVIYTLQATAQQVALLRICELAPGIIVGLLAGVWVDRLKRRQVMIVSDAIRALLVGSIPLFFFMGHLGWMQLFFVAIAVSVLTVTFESAYSAYIPTLVGDGQITDANGKLAATGAVSEVVGFGLSGALFEWLGGAWTLSIDALSFLFSAFALLSIRKSEPRFEHGEEHEPLLRELADGLRYLWTNKTLTILSGVAGIQNVFYGISGTVYVLYISRELDVSPGIQGVLYAVGGIGSFATAALSDVLFRQIAFGKLLVLVSIIGIIGSALLPFASGPLWLLISFVVAQQLIGDGADIVFEIGVSSFCQSQTANAFLGRVNSIWQVITSICLLAGTVLGGELATVWGLRNTLFVAVGVRIVGFGLTSMPRLRNVVGMDAEAEY